MKMGVNNGKCPGAGVARAGASLVFVLTKNDSLYSVGQLSRPFINSLYAASFEP